MRFKYILLNLLIASSLQAQVNVWGEQYGTWGAEDSLYIVIGDIYVPPSQFLTILSGVEVRFQGQFKITVAGGLTAWGTETDSVIFRTFLPDPWDYIEFNNSWGDSTTLNYCSIQSGDRAVRVTDCQVSLNHCLIRGMTSSPVWGDNAMLYLSKCVITQNLGNGLLIDNTSSAVLTDCEISYNSGGNGRGIFVQNGSTVNVSGGEIRNNSGSGIYGFSAGSCTLNNVKIGENGGSGVEMQSCGELNASRVQSHHNDVHGIFLVNTTLDANNLTVTTNTGRGVSFTGTVHIFDLSSSIVDRNGQEGLYYQLGGACVIRYNDTYLNTGENYSGCSPGVGSIEVDPLYVDWFNMNYNLQDSSLCIDAGDPGDPLDPDGTRTDMGALYFNQSPGAVEPGEIPQILSDFRIVAAYPNPFNPVLTIRIQAPAPAAGRLEAWTPQGRLVDRIWQGTIQPGVNVYTWQANLFPSGVYLVRMISGSYVDTVPCILLK
jgi:hypothetical protein